MTKFTSDCTYANKIAYLLKNGRDVTVGKIEMRPLQWWAESAPLVRIGLRYLKVDLGRTSRPCGYIPDLYTMTLCVIYLDKDQYCTVVLDGLNLSKFLHDLHQQVWFLF